MRAAASSALSTFAFASTEPFPASAITARTHSSAAAARSSASLTLPCHVPRAACEPSGEVCAVMLVTRPPRRISSSSAARGAALSFLLTTFFAYSK